MTKMTYLDQLRHPNWQRKRLEALSRAQFTCEKCDATEKTLNVHHRFYVKGRKAWEYVVDDLQVLCEDCHQLTHEQKVIMDRELAKLEPWEVPSTHALLVGFRGALVESEGAPQEFADAVLMDGGTVSKAYWCGQVARVMFGDMTDEQVGLVFSALHGLQIDGFVALVGAAYQEKVDAAKATMKSDEVPPSA